MSDLPKYGVKELARFAAIANLDAFVSYSYRYTDLS
jgi:hypothetical protein